MIKSGNHPQECRLAAPARSNNAQEFSFIHVKRDILQRRYDLRWVFVDLCHVGQFHMQVLPPPLDAILKPLKEGSVYRNRDQTNRHYCGQTISQRMS